MRPAFRDALIGFLRLRCPRCRLGRLFRSGLQLFQHCPVCGLSYYREPGYYVGAMIVNYAATTAIVVAVFLATLLLPTFRNSFTNGELLAWCAFAIAVSIGLTRHTKSFWLAMDYWVDPWDPPDSRQVAARSRT